MKVIIAQQARITHHCKSTKEKLLKVKAAIWFNRLCGIQHSTPKYIQIKEMSTPRKWQLTRNM
jgi:ribosomal protein L37AE/L43A